jgi:hypothetical protein
VTDQADCQPEWSAAAEEGVSTQPPMRGRSALRPIGGMSCDRHIELSRTKVFRIMQEK